MYMHKCYTLTSMKMLVKLLKEKKWKRKLKNLNFNWNLLKSCIIRKIFLELYNNQSNATNLNSMEPLFFMIAKAHFNPAPPVRVEIP